MQSHSPLRGISGWLVPGRTLLATLGCIALGGLFLAGVHGCQGPQRTSKSFTEQEVTQVIALLEGVDPSTYRIVLPRFRGTEQAGTQTLGTLPVTAVQRVASSKQIAFDPGANLQAIFSANGGGAGSHTPSQTPGTDLGRRLDAILRNIDRNAYIWVR
ncbi:MAG TPA: hypothetical protein PKC43_09650 [Phycisphaerales bacterium]|nr:hypothetical protein [Phycisphaerales bacterium]HMP37698.1 hypothetical protein [Phycisphaerales bacterium]